MTDEKANGHWRSRIIGTGEEPPEQLLANPRNYRIHPKAQQDALEGVLSEVGWVQNIIVNQRGNNGHFFGNNPRNNIPLFSSLSPFRILL